VPVLIGVGLSCAPADPGRSTGGTKGSGGSDATGSGGSGGSSTGTGGATTGTGGATTGTGGATTGTGGATTGTGGATTGTGGATTGTGGATTGTGGATTGTGGATTGTGGATTGTGGAAGTTTGTGGAAGATTGTGGAAGATTGTGGTAGTGAAGKGGAAGSGGSAGGTSVDAGGPIIDVAKGLNGLMLLGPCLQDTEASVCATAKGACPPANTADRALSGGITSDKMVTIGGTMGTPYTVTLHIQGEVESKQYGGMDQNQTAQSPKADGFCVGGTPTTADAYNVYMIRVTNPGAAKTDYFLNSLQPPGTPNHTTYGIDYTAKIPVQGGAQIRLVAADSNCSMIKNCGPQVSGTTCLAPITMTGIEPEAISLNPTFNFTTPYNGQWVVMTVKDVTSP